MLPVVHCEAALVRRVHGFVQLAEAWTEDVASVGCVDVKKPFAEGIHADCMQFLRAAEQALVSQQVCCASV